MALIQAEPTQNTKLNIRGLKYHRQSESFAMVISKDTSQQCCIEREENGVAVVSCVFLKPHSASQDNQNSQIQLKHLLFMKIDNRNLVNLIHVMFYHPIYVHNISQ